MKKISTIKITTTALFSAIVAMLAFMPLKTMGLEITFTMVPIAIGAALYGPSVGAILGGVFGVVSFLQCLGYSPFGAALFGINPYLTALVCIPTRILAGFLAGLAYKIAMKLLNNKYIGCVAASLIAPLLNTVFFMGTLVLCFYNSEYIQSFVTYLGAVNPFMFIILFVGINGLVELACGVIIAVPASIQLQKIK